MVIHGLQKMTLLDFPGRVACTVFLGGCDLRCPFCHNSELIDGGAKGVMDEKELLAFLQTRKGLLDGVAFTGGEPLLRSDLKNLIKAVKALGYAVKLDTNGTHPERLAELLSEGLLDYVAMDIKNSAARYGETAGIIDFDIAPIERSIDLLMHSGVAYEFRTTVIAELHDAASFEAIAKRLRGAERYFLQQFVLRDSVVYDLHPATEEEMRRYLEIVKKEIPSAELRGM